MEIIKKIGVLPLIFLVLFIGLIYIIFKLMYLSFSGDWQQIEYLRNDNQGLGHFGASRSNGTRKHKGVDLIANAGTYVFAPFKGIVTKLGIAYSSTNKFRYIEFKGSGLLSIYKIRLFYTSQDYPQGLKKGDKFIKGQSIGQVQDIALHHGGGMKNHIHVEAYVLGKLVDPTPFIKFST